MCLCKSLNASRTTTPRLLFSSKTWGDRALPADTDRCRSSMLRRGHQYHLSHLKMNPAQEARARAPHACHPLPEFMLCRGRRGQHQHRRAQGTASRRRGWGGGQNFQVKNWACTPGHAAHACHRQEAGARRGVTPGGYSVRAVIHTYTGQALRHNPLPRRTSSSTHLRKNPSKFHTLAERAATTAVEQPCRLQPAPAPHWRCPSQLPTLHG